MENEGSVCDVCKDYIHNLEHNNTVNHRFHFKKWEYNNYRKALQKNRHGIELEVKVEKLNNFHFDFRSINGKYVTMVSPEQLRLHSFSLVYVCKIKNTRKDSIYVLDMTLLHPSHYYTTSHQNEIGDGETLLELKPGSQYIFKVIFKTDVLTFASYKIPLSCNFQTVDNKNAFTIVRTFLTIVDDQKGMKEQKIKSPFTCQQWKDVEKTLPSSKDTGHTDEYGIPDKYLKLFSHALKRFDRMSVSDEDNLRELNQLLRSLTKQNYNKYWHIILWIEERVQSMMLMKYNMEKVTMEMKRDGILILEVPGLAEKRPSVILGDFIKIRITGDHQAYTGFVCQVNDKTVEISHVDDELIDYLQGEPKAEMDVSFVLGRLSFERMHKAVDKIVSNEMVNKLFPPSSVRVRTNTAYPLHDKHFFNKTICKNEDQKKAVDQILNSTHDFPYIVFGPPGTGKTVTIVETILQIKKRTVKRILVCAPSNSACDMLALKLIPHCTKNELFRIHSSTRETTTITEELTDYSNIEDDEFTRVTPDTIMSYRIVVTTLVLIGRFIGAYYPDCVFIDEAAQASEPETDIAISLLSVGKQLVLAGDPQQLGPMTTKLTEKYGYGKSLLERLMDCDIYKLNPRTKKYNTNFITMLKLNFRSHPEILLIPNKLFYNNLLLPISKTAQNDPLVDIAIYGAIENKSNKFKGRAIEFCSVSSREMKEGSSPSFFNLCESKMVVKYVQALHSLPLPAVYRVRDDQIGVVTPYKRQVFKIKEDLKHSGFEDVEVGTTESFQGREKRIIIISTVRAQHSLLLHDRKYNLGFVQHDQRFNVAVTRAISKLIVIGCPLVLRTDTKWAEYMDYCEEYQTYYGNKFEPIDDTFKENVISRMSHFKEKDDQYRN